MTWFRDRRFGVLLGGAVLVAGASGAALHPLGGLHTLLFHPGEGVARWIENVPAGSEIERALYRALPLPGGEVLFRRAPAETVPALTELAKAHPDAALYSLRALEEEQKLDFDAAERDWKSWAEQAPDRVGAQIDLADFYERRLQPQPELAALLAAAGAAPDERERWTADGAQRSWKVFERALHVVELYALPQENAARIYAAWVDRYPREPEARARQFAYLLERKDFAGASEAIARYRAAFPADRVFPVKAEADLTVRRGKPGDGLAVYEARFGPLWPAELIKSYYGLVTASRSQRAMGDALRARLAASPDDLRTAARLFYLYQQQGQLDSAKAVLARYRESKEKRGAAWTAEELDTLERLYEAQQDIREAARYAYALAADRTAPDAEQRGTVALARLLLTAPEQPLRVGAGNLALYRNIATMDRGPGYLNGILSLFLNTQDPAGEFASEEQTAVPYFHRARAAELLKEIDRRFPDEPARPGLHASLMEAYGAYGEDAAAIREGTAVLAQFPKYDGRVHAALVLADAYQRTKQPEKEFALYQDLLKELSARADGIPLGMASDAYSKPVDDAAPRTSGVRSVEYNEVLNRYLARLVTLDRLPDALQVLRGELDRNPQDPGLYEKLADFLAQNRMNAHQEEVYERAIQQFQDTGWYAKLARFYARERRSAEYSALLHKVAGIFSGTELEGVLNEAPAPDKSLALEVDLYAHERFPHDLRFVERLLGHYGSAHNEAAREKLLWEHWWESPELRDELFEQLSRTGRLEATLATLRQQSPEIGKGAWTELAGKNPAAGRFWLEACLWQSHYEQGVDAAGALAAAYPADSVLGAQASSLYRSLAYFHPEDTDRAVEVEKRLLASAPGDLDRLARIGDIYADRERFAEAAPYWTRMAEVHPGDADGYLQSATVFWDYFDFATAQAQLDKGRARLERPALFGYQVGSIAEGRGDLPAAVRAYAASAMAEDANGESRGRLLVLARRPAVRAAVEEGTAGLLTGAAPTAGGIELRAGILEAERRNGDLESELKRLVERTGSFDVLDAVAAAARSHTLPGVEEAALRRQIALTADPVENLQLRYRLVDLLEARGGPAAAQEIDAIDREHGKILGVVRATVDFDWNHDRRPQAVTVLEEAARVAYPELRSRFQLEAARKLTLLTEYARARAILEGLLSEKPLDAGYEDAMADNLARAGDAAGLASFYRAQLERVRGSALPREDKQQRTGQLRRGMIGAATLLGSYNDAVDQYIELINAYPDDAALAQEAALYADAHGARDRLLGFYKKTIAQSPRDPRWSIVLARLGTAVEDYALAVDAYGQALKLRPERQDLYSAQASLDERLHRLDDAIALYRRLYTLSYRDPRWMEKVAELSVRQGRAADAVKALEAAWIEGRPARAANAFTVAERLEQWGLLDEAQRFAEQGSEQAGADLLVSEQQGAATYARILARKRQAAVALAHLAVARQAAPNLTLSAVAGQVAKQGLAAITDDEWRKQRQAQRRELAAAGFAEAVKSLGAVAGRYYTPEERQGFAALLRQQATGASSRELASIYIPAAKAASLAALTADLEWTAATNASGRDVIGVPDWLQLERRRGRLDAAASQVEKLAATRSTQRRAELLRMVAQAYRDAGDGAGELRVLGWLHTVSPLDGDDLDRYFHLLLAARPDEMVQLAAYSDAAANYLVRHAATDRALSGVAARAAGRPAVWRDAYTALTGLYLRERRPEIRAAFVSALDADATIAERLTLPPDRNAHLSGDVWFYYGDRFAAYLDNDSDPRAEEFLDAGLEHAPASATAYLRTADYARETHRSSAALEDYKHSLDLHRDQPSVLNRIAEIDWESGDHAAALAAWSEAVHLLAAEMDVRHVPESFWDDFSTVLGNIAAHGQYDTVRAAVDAMLRVYVRRNGDYRADPLLRAGYAANGNSIAWVIAMSASAADPQRLLDSLLPSEWSRQDVWMTPADESRVHERIMELTEAKAQQNSGVSSNDLDSARQGYVRALLREKGAVDARAVLGRVPVGERLSANWLPLMLQVADADGSLKSLLEGWRKDTVAPTDDNALRSGVTNLSPEGGRAVLRFVYERALERRELVAPNFLGLAAIDLDENRTADAMQLLRRMTLLSENTYGDLDSAARLLEERKHPAEAIEFLKPLAESSPWNVEYRVRLARAQLAIDPQQPQALAALSGAVADPRAPYTVRVTAAQALRGHGAAASGSAELEVLAQTGCPTAESVTKPLFIASRVAAAACTSPANAKERLLRAALEAAPDDVAIRLNYATAAFAAGENARALVSAEPFLQNAYYYSGYGAAAAQDSVGDDESTPQTESLSQIDPVQAAALVRSAAEAYLKRGEYDQAAQCIRNGLGVPRRSGEQKQLLALQERIELERTRRQENDTRAPDLHAELDQGHVVLPRLLKGMPVPVHPKKDVEVQE